MIISETKNMDYCSKKNVFSLMKMYQKSHTTNNLWAASNNRLNEQNLRLSSDNNKLKAEVLRLTGSNNKLNATNQDLVNKNIGLLAENKGLLAVRETNLVDELHKAKPEKAELKLHYEQYFSVRENVTLEDTVVALTAENRTLKSTVQHLKMSYKNLEIEKEETKGQLFDAYSLVQRQRFRKARTLITNDEGIVVDQLKYKGYFPIQEALSGNHFPDDLILVAHVDGAVHTTRKNKPTRAL